MDYIKVVAQYKTSKDKESFIKKHIKRSYIPYAEKLSEAIEIANRSTHMSVEDKVFYKKNTPIMRFMSMVRIIALYTDIECGQDKVVEMYDVLSKEGLMVQLLSSIPETEISEFMSLVDMSVSDIYENERDLSALLDSKMTALEFAMNTLLDSFQSTLENIDAKQLLNDIKNEQVNQEDNNK